MTLQVSVITVVTLNIYIRHNVFEYEFLKIIDMIKLLVTDYKKVNLYGDGLAYEEGKIMYPFIGQAIRIKILGLWWKTYRSYSVKAEYF